jgi:hypothetical protein
VDFLVGILALVIGVAVCLAGLRWFFVLLPVFGFVAGFMIGAAAITALFGDGFLSTSLGIVVGVIGGLIGAVLSYFFWYVGLILAAGLAGGSLGASLFAAIGVDASWLLFIIGLISAIIFIIAAMVLAFPIFLVIVNTAIAGSAVAIGGVFLVFNQIDREDIGNGVVWTRIHDHWFLWLIWIAFAGFGIFSQIRMMAEVTLPDDKWTTARPAMA